MMERLLEVEVTEHGTITEEIERTKVKKGRMKMSNSMKKLILTGAASMVMLSLAATPAMAIPSFDPSDLVASATPNPAGTKPSDPLAQTSGAGSIKPADPAPPTGGAGGSAPDPLGQTGGAG